MPIHPIKQDPIYRARLKGIDQGCFNKVIDYVKLHRPNLLAEVEENYKELSAFNGSTQEYIILLLK